MQVGPPPRRLLRFVPLIGGGNIGGVVGCRL
jgi:hypothetical protein